MELRCRGLGEGDGDGWWSNGEGRGKVVGPLCMRELA